MPNESTPEYDGEECIPCGTSTTTSIALAYHDIKLYSDDATCMLECVGKAICEHVLMRHGSTIIIAGDTSVAYGNWKSNTMPRAYRHANASQSEREQETKHEDVHDPRDLVRITQGNGSPWSAAYEHDGMRHIENNALVRTALRDQNERHPASPQ